MTAPVTPRTADEIEELAERLAELAYADRPPLGKRPVPWPPRVRKDWQAWARRIAARLPVPAPTPAGLDEERLGFYDLLDMADAILRHYPPDTIVCSHLHRADVGARTVAAIADLIESARLSRESDR
jgi:hypothetical protein